MDPAENDWFAVGMHESPFAIPLVESAVEED
jgi:hypothetical protein